MKLTDLYESAPLVARFYKEANPDFDKRYNREAYEIAGKNEEYYKKYFKEDETPVFTKPLVHDEKNMTTKPDLAISQPSAGYRGLQRAKAKCGQKYDREAMS